MMIDVPLAVLSVGVLAQVTLADTTLAPADNAAFTDEFKGRSAVAGNVPTAPAKYRRPAGWKPTPPCPKTLPEIAREIGRAHV